MTDSQSPPGPSTIDPIAAEIIRQRLLAVPELVDKNVTRTAFSPIIADYKDYAVGIVDREGRLIAQCKGGITVFVANALGTAVLDGIATYGYDGIERGDVFITNHAGTMGQHLNNVVMYTPVFSGPHGRELFGFMAVVFHWMDVGGAIVGSCVSNTTTDIYQEGVQFRSIKLCKRGEPIEEIFRVIEYNTRFPDMVLGDLRSQLAGCLKGREMLDEIISRYGVDHVRAAVHVMWDQSERTARAAIAAIPDGSYRASSFLDNDGIRLDQRICIDITVRVKGDELTVDFSDVADQLPGPLNSGRQGGAVAAARIACKYLLTPDEPANDGAFRPLHVVIPDGKFLSARADAPMGGSGSTLPTVIDTILWAVAGAAPERVSAGHHGTFGIHMFFGRHPATGEVYKHGNTAIGGWGAAADGDGEGPYRSMVHADTFEMPVEMQEAMFPCRIDSFGLRTDSAGPGRFRGGLGIERVYTALAAMSFSASFERTLCKPWGLNGGAEGEPGFVEMVCDASDGAQSRRFAKDSRDLHAGQQLVVRTGGGGGYGPALSRDVEKVVDDVRDGYVSRERAATDYGVVIDDQLNVLLDETRSLRSKRLETGSCGPSRSTACREMQ